LWEAELTNDLVKVKWKDLLQYGIHCEKDYSTARCILKNQQAARPTHVKQLTPYELMLEFDNNPLLGEFYLAHGIELLPETEWLSRNTSEKVFQAYQVLSKVPGVVDCVSALVKSILVLYAEDAEYDLSYSHPDIPFSIFISLGHDQSSLCNFRVAESILHESMHLKLTLIDQVTPLVEINSKQLFYSPWREEQRPANGILHGLFVFTAILQFYNSLDISIEAADVKSFITSRQDEISTQIVQLKNFQDCIDLTNEGALLTKSLLTLS